MMADNLDTYAIAPVQYPLWHGEQHVHAVWFAFDLHTEAYRQAMIVQLWQPGAQAYRFGSGDLLLWPKPRRLRCEHMSGLPLCKIGSLLSSAPLTAAEIKQLQYADAFVVQAAQAQPLQFANATLLNPADWINLQDYALQPALQLLLAEPELPQLQAPPQLESIHDIFGSNIPQPSAERNQLLQQLLEGQPGVAPVPSQPVSRGLGQGGGSGASIPGLNWVIGVVFLMALYGLVQWAGHTHSAIADSTLSQFPQGSSTLQVPQVPVSGWSVLMMLSLLAGACACIWLMLRQTPGGGEVKPQKPTVANNELTSRQPVVQPVSPRMSKSPQSGRRWVQDQPAAHGRESTGLGRIMLGIAAFVIVMFGLIHLYEHKDTRPPVSVAKTTTVQTPAPQQAPKAESGSAKNIIVFVLLILGLFAAVWFLLRTLSDDVQPVRRRVNVDTGAGYDAGTTTRSLLQTAEPDSKPRPGLLARWLQKLSGLAPVSDLLGRQHAAYMRKMLALFEQNNLDEALRHAIPMGGQHDVSLGQSMGMLRPRQHLQLSAGQASYGQMIGVDDRLQRYMTELYEKAFVQYDRLGAVDKAVYVLAELLNQRQRALDYLETHQRYMHAADLSVAWEFPAAKAIRLYVLAGEADKARQLAMQTQEYAAAIRLLEDGHPQQAVELRKMWAQHRVAQGCWLEAVEAIWMLESERQTAIDWLRQAELSQGELGIRAWLQRLALQPEHLALELARAQQLCQPQHVAQLKLAIQEVFAIYNQSQRLLPAALINLWTPYMLLQYEQRGSNISLKEVRCWLDWTDNGTLKADMPQLQQHSKKAAGLSSAELVLDAPAAGLWEIYDAWPLSLARNLLALGEAGMVIVNAQYEQEWRLNIPAHRIVLSDTREIALLLAYRQDQVRVHRVNLVTQEVVDLGVTRLDMCADTFDGVAWLLADGQQLQIVDTRHSARQLLFSPTQLSGPVRDIARNGNIEALLVDDPTGLSLCCYRLPYRRMVEQELVKSKFQHLMRNWSQAASHMPLVFNTRPADATLLGSEATVTRFWYYPDEAHEYLFHAWQGTHHYTAVLRPPNFPNYQRAKAHLFGQWHVMLFEALGQSVWVFYNDKTRQIHLTLNWPASVEVNIHYIQGEWVLFDSQGRLVRVNEQTQDVQRMTLG
jgi:hypothetical protein